MGRPPLQENYKLIKQVATFRAEGASIRPIAITLKRSPTTMHDWFAWPPNVTLRALRPWRSFAVLQLHFLSSTNVFTVSRFTRSKAMASTVVCDATSSGKPSTS
jgi:hypothetical protein